MKIVDIVIGVLLVWGFYRGYLNGIIVGIAHIFAILFSIYCWVRFSIPIQNFFGSRVQGIHSALLLSILTFFLLYIIVHLLSNLIAFKIENIAKNLKLGYVNRIMGGIFGVIKWVVLLSVFIFVFNTINQQIHIVSSENLNNSWLYSKISKVIPVLLPQLHKLVF